MYAGFPDFSKLDFLSCVYLYKPGDPKTFPEFRKRRLKNSGLDRVSMM
ncbi:hypothetical protein LEP1GSC061_3920 [Leptospira wolffii serovar Khorat str. Khorat-H2]|nr:hypothetical protein LEP1GSC061_3920 [Leptospira wolffii serovar Khorat str. Khorat-H2]